MSMYIVAFDVPAKWHAYCKEGKFALVREYGLRGHTSDLPAHVPIGTRFAMDPERAYVLPRVLERIVRENRLRSIEKAGVGRVTSFDDEVVGFPIKGKPIMEAMSKIMTGLAAFGVVPFEKDRAAPHLPLAYKFESSPVGDLYIAQGALAERPRPADTIDLNELVFLEMAEDQWYEKHRIIFM